MRTNDEPPDLSEAHQLLPAHLRARAAPTLGGCVRPDGEFVLCWLHHAVRGHENPVLDATVHLGNQLGKPVLVYQGLGGKHRYNSDRHHVFIMQGARDLQAELAARGIAYAFHLPKDPNTPGPLPALANRACLVVTEDFPAPPFPRWTQRLAERTNAAILPVDGACLMPIRSLKHRHTRAFKFRDAAKRQWRGVIAEAWADVDPEPPPLDVPAAGVGFEPADLANTDLAELAAACDIDHGIPPVGRVEGGSRAGYRRWAEFRDRHLSRYDRRRNDAADMDAVSGLSPYLHHGHVSPFRLARDAHARGGKGAEKFLDELLVWRELAFNFCAHTPEDRLESLAALPDWAQRTLADHAGDERPAAYDWETLARAATGHPLWDSAQRSLVRNGELHNNLRMTWGKAIAMWSSTPERALEYLIDLNHRYALDGSNPNSYGGLLWCLGQFDRPFAPEQPVLGTVRGRSIDDHADRLSPSRYAAAVEARRGFQPVSVAVVGAGIAGLTCARALQEQGCAVTVFDRGRGPGGRMSSRLSRGAPGPSFDHGAPHFTVRDPRFGRYVRSWIEAGVCARWHATRARWIGDKLEPVGDDTPLIVGQPSMSALCEHLAGGLDLQTATTVAAIRREPSGWSLACDGDPDRGPFQTVVLAMAPEQALRLAGPTGASFEAELRSMHSVPTWVGMLGVRGVGRELPDVLEVARSDAIDKIVRNERKPGRTETDQAALTVYARTDWSAARFDADRAAVADELLEHTLRLLSDVCGRAVEVEGAASAHRWGFGRLAEPVRHPCLVDASAALIVCGEGFGGTGVEAAFLSGRAAAGRALTLRAARAARDDREHGSLFADAAT